MSVVIVSAAGTQEKTITLPTDHDYGKLKLATHGDLAQAQCQFCHSTDYIVMQPPGDAKQWEGVVTKDDQGLRDTIQRGRRQGHC